MVIEKLLPVAERSKLLPVCKSQTKSGSDDTFLSIISHTGALDAAAARIQQLEEEIKELTTELAQLKVAQVYFHRLLSDKDIIFYTSRDVFYDFWEGIQPSASRVVYWSTAYIHTNI